MDLTPGFTGPLITSGEHIKRMAGLAMVLRCGPADMHDVSRWIAGCDPYGPDSTRLPELIRSRLVAMDTPADPLDALLRAVLLGASPGDALTLLLDDA